VVLLKDSGVGHHRSRVQPELVVLEASGGYETAVVEELAAASIASSTIVEFCRAQGVTSAD
jgi:hypothetical protein